MRRVICVVAAALLTACSMPPLVRPEIAPGAATGTVIVYRGFVLTGTALLFGENGKPYLGLKGSEHGAIKVSAGPHQFEAWSYSALGHEEWKPHATLDLQVG